MNRRPKQWLSKLEKRQTLAALACAAASRFGGADPVRQKIEIRISEEEGRYEQRRVESALRPKTP